MLMYEQLIAPFQNMVNQKCPIETGELLVRPTPVNWVEGVIVKAVMVLLARGGCGTYSRGRGRDTNNLIVP
jgi:hypothetical protein